MPNNDTVARTDWHDYVVSVDEVEQKTGYDFFSTLDANTQKQIENKIYRKQ